MCSLLGLPAIPGVGPLNAASLSAAQMMNPFGALPMMNPLDLGMAAAAQAGMFSFMYPGMGMMYPGMGMPMMPPAAMMPGWYFFPLPSTSLVYVRFCLILSHLLRCAIFISLQPFGSLSLPF